jgi:hypothetical protein
MTNIKQAWSGFAGLQHYLIKADRSPSAYNIHKKDIRCRYD